VKHSLAASAAFDVVKKTVSYQVGREREKRNAFLMVNFDWNSRGLVGESDHEDPKLRDLAESDTGDHRGRVGWDSI